MILQIDVTVAGPDGVATGSAAVTVNETPPPAAARTRARPASADRVTDEELALLRARQRAELRRGTRP